MFTVNEKNYDFRISVGRLRQVEDRIGTSIMSALQRTQGMLSLSTLDAIFTLCTIREGGNGYLPPEEGRKVCEAAMDEVGYAVMLEHVASALQRDCPFLFRTQN